jgi:hypothetical protein
VHARAVVFLPGGGRALPGHTRPEGAAEGDAKAGLQRGGGGMALGGVPIQLPDPVRAFEGRGARLRTEIHRGVFAAPQLYHPLRLLRTKTAARGRRSRKTDLSPEGPTD